MQKRHRLASALLLSLLLSACAGLKVPGIGGPSSEEPPTPPATTAPVSERVLKPVAWSDLPGWADDDQRAAWPAFRQSCRGLANKAQWKKVCEAGAALDPTDRDAVRRFFEENFRPHAVLSGEGKTTGLLTGYYEPMLKGAPQPTKAAKYPVLGVPDDLLTIDLSEVYPDLKNLRLRGRIQGNKVVPYYSRAEIEAQPESRRGKVLAWVDDAVELFFLQIQGSGRVQMPDGSLLRVGYADQNGHPYHSIGRVLIERGELKPEEASMQGIQAWARRNPRKLPELLNTNPSYVFFRELPANNDGPLGALGVPLTPERSLAVDARSVPLGSPVFIDSTQPNSTIPLRRLMLAQDTGGAIKGAIRADFFWGFGHQAGEQAGRMKQALRYWVLVPL